jgi:hypothetical protein
MSQQSNLTRMLRRQINGLGDVPSDYGPQYSGVVMAPYDTNGPLGGMGDTSPMSFFGSKTTARAQFLTWLKDFNPALFEEAVKRAEAWKSSVAAKTGNPAALSGLGDGDTTPTTWWQKIVDTLPSLGTAYLAYKGQQNVLDTNIQRANMGLPPIDPTTGAPTVKTAVSLSPQLMARLQDTGSYLLIGGAVLAGVFLLSKMLGGKRR